MADNIQLKVQYSDGGALASLTKINEIAQYLNAHPVKLNTDFSALEKATQANNALLSTIRDITSEAAKMEQALSKATQAGTKVSSIKMQEGLGSRYAQISSDASYQAKTVAFKDQSEKMRRIIQQGETVNSQYADSWGEIDSAQISAKQSGEQVGSTISKIGTQAEKAGNSLLENAKKFATWMLLGNAISGVKRAFEEALDEMKKADAELVTVRKVTGMTTDELERLNETAFATATKYGESASEYLANVAEFARAGYGDTADELAELSVKTQIVGDTTAETANQFLLAVDAAYKYNGSITALSRVLDGANEIDNKYATSIEKIASGLGIVAPVAAQANIGIDELTAAIGTITAVTQRSGSEAATALRAIILNIVGDTKTEIEDGATWTAGQIKGLSDIIKIYAKDAYDAAQASGEVLNPMKAIAGLAQSVKDGVLSASQLYEMVSDIGGKLRASQLTALVQNWDMYESMLADYATAYGSAEKEIENATDSWERKTKQLQNTWTEFIQKSINTSSIKGLIDFAKWIVTFENSLGTAALKWTAFAVALNSGKVYDVFTKLISKGGQFFQTLNGGFALLRGNLEKSNVYQHTFNQLLTQEALKLGVTTDKVDANTRAQIANTAAKKAAASAIISWVGIAVTAAATVYQIYSYFEAKAAQTRQQIIENSKATAEQVDNLAELIQQYETLSKERKDGGAWDNTQISQAKSLQEQITALVGEQANQLDLVNGKYSEQTKLLKERLAVEAHEGIADANDAEKAALKNVKKALSPFNNADTSISFSSKDSDILDYINNSEYLTGIYDGVISWEKQNFAYITDLIGSRGEIESAEDAIKYFDELKGLRMRFYEADPDSQSYKTISEFIAKNKDIFKELETIAETKKRYDDILAGNWDKIFPNGNGNGSSGGEGGITPTTDDVKKLYEELEKAINKQLDARKKELDAIKEAHEVVKETLNLEEKRLKVAEARKALESAEKERTIRVYNAATGQWEWQADESAIEKAKENLKSAKEDLDEAEWQSQYNAKLRAYEEEKKHYKDIFEKAEDIADKTRSIDDILDDIKKNQLPEFQNVFEALIKKLGGGSDASGAGTTGTVENKGYTAPEGASANWFDMVMSGIKQRDATRGSKSESSKGLSEEDVERFERFDWKDRGYTFQRPQNSAKSFGDTYNNSRETEFNRITERLSTTNNNLNRNDTRNYYVGGVSVAKEKLEAMSALDALDNLSLFVNSMTL